jgi:hypothetical protein
MKSWRIILARERLQMHKKFSSENLKGKDHSENEVIEGRKIIH